jgi:ABC-2 type transport system ATP-binding protein
MKIVEFQDIHRAYKRGVNVLDGVSFSIERGEVVGLLGRNGAGKTTLIRITMGVIEAQRGAVRVFGLNPRENPIEVKSRVGYVSEDQILPTFLRISELIELHRRLFRTWDDQMAARLMDRFELSPGEKVSRLSKGQARQVALLCAVSHRPEFLVLDEPAGGLDPVARREFLETSINLLNEEGTTILFSSNQMTDVERLARRVVLIHRGRILIDSDMDQLREGYSVLLVPHVSNLSKGDLLDLEGCLGVRERSDALHAVFRLDPEDAEGLLREKLGVEGARRRSVDLEAMFIELVGGQL